MKKMNEAKQFNIFSEENLGRVRTMFDPKTGAVYFHATDVAKCLGHRSAATAVSIHTLATDRIILNRKDLPEEVRSIFWSSTRGRGQVTFLSEGAIYKLIMVSRTEEAARFKDWVCNTVLTSIRQNGGYILGQEDIPDTEKVANEIQSLRAKVLDQTNKLVKAKEDVERLQKRRHELIADIKDVTEKNKGLKKSLQYMIDDANHWYNMFNGLAERYADLDSRYSSLLKDSKIPAPAVILERDDEYAVLPNGMVIKTSEWKDYRNE